MVAVAILLKMLRASAFLKGCDSMQRVQSLRISGNNSPSFVVRERENSGRRPGSCSAGPTIPLELAKPLLFPEQGKEEGLCFSFPPKETPEENDPPFLTLCRTNKLKSNVSRNV